MTKRCDRRSSPTVALGLLLAGWSACHYTPDDSNLSNKGTPGPCRSKALGLTTAGSGEKDPCRPTLCSLEPDGTVTMSYCLEGKEGVWPWASCTIAIGQDLNGFDPDHVGQGVLEVVFCTDTLISGALDIWYGDPQFKRAYQRVKYLELLGAGETMDVGCRTVYLTPEKARIPYFNLSDTKAEDQANSLPQSCSDQCGDTPPECTDDFGKVSLTLAGEFLLPGKKSDAKIRVLSISYLSDGCLCSDDLGCDEERSICRAGAFSAFVCSKSPPREGGVCAVGGAAACGDMVGRYADGWHTGASDAFLAAYLRHSPRLGCPFGNNGGSPYVHDVWGMDVQDYLQPDSGMQISTDGQTGLVYKEGTSEVFLVFGDFWWIYKCLRDGGHSVGGSTLLGAPLDEQSLAGDAIRQDFERGWLARRGGDATVTLHLSEHRFLDGDVTSECPPVLIENPD